MSDSSLRRTASWVITDRRTGEVIMETFCKGRVTNLNTDRYKATPIAEHLGALNRNVQPVAK